MSIGQFIIKKTEGRARRGSYETAHGVFQTPAFMPVGTQGTVKGLTPRDLKEIGAEIILSNTYHLHLRPGDELIRDLGGLHKFMGWEGPILTDSGGFQIFSLAKLRALDAEGVRFQSHVDGATIKFTPESVVRVQENLGVDIMMALDECLAYPAARKDAQQSLALTKSWLERAARARSKGEVLLFGIMQGGMFRDLREEAAEHLRSVPVDGCAIGGLSVGEPPEMMHELAAFSADLLPGDKIRYLMGVGTPLDLVRAVGAGIDLFDCVMPTRSARFGRLFTGFGFINIRNAEYRRSEDAIEAGCDCYTCRTFSRAYLSHLIHAKEVLAVQLASVHNLRYYQRLMRRIRTAVEEGSFAAFAAEFQARSIEADEPSAAAAGQLGE